MTSDRSHARSRQVLLAALGVVVLLVGVGVASWSLADGLFGPASIFGPREDDRELVEAMQADPAAGLAPPDATLEYEWSGVESSHTVYRSFCTRQPVRDVRRFYGEALPDLGWSAAERSGNFSKVIGGREISLGVGRNADDECRGFDVLMSSDGADA